MTVCAAVALASAEPPVNEPACLTPQGTLCRTIRWEYTGWENQSWGFHAIKRWNASWTLSYKRDGSMMERDARRFFRNYVIPDGGWDLGNIKLPEKGETIILDHSAKEYRVRRGVGGGLAVWNPNDRDCKEYASAFGLFDLKRVGEVVIAGIPSVEYTGVRSSNRRVTVALAPSLGCTQMRNIDRSYNRFGLPTAYHRSEVVSVQLGEPDAALFEVPKDYRQANR